MSEKIKLGISTCLLGEKVRYDGGHKYDPFMVQTLGKFVDYVPVCPEVECGFSIPREAFRLIGDPESPRLVTVRTKKDVTDQMLQWARKRVKQLENDNLSGFIFKSKSPSSGLFRVKVYNNHGMPLKAGKGIFARVFTDHFPLLPVEEEGRLHDPKLRENFIERVFVYKRWKDMLLSNADPGKLVAFHTKNKLLMMSHSPEHYREAGKLTADVKNYSFDDCLNRYQKLLLEAMALKTTPRKHVNVLQHILGYFKKDLTSDEKQEMLEIIDIYRKGLVPLIVPITLCNHYVRKYNKSYLRQQIYLNPHPLELQLRNHV
ncbi:DUF523 and DUF1722 domain-containing protein [bacterium]|nr:DUF523 and DUF1722 domain-containing protein [candidate division CSSED10-310 bacterium]